MSKNVYEGLSKESEDILKIISKENGGKITLNDEGNEYVFRKTKNMFEGIENVKKFDEKKEEKKEEQKAEKKEGESNLEMLENKIVEPEKEKETEQDNTNENKEEKLD